MSEQTSSVLAVARREARAQVSSGHLLLGALHPDGGDVLRRINLDAESTAARALVRAGPDLAELRGRVRAMSGRDKATKVACQLKYSDRQPF